MKVARWAMLAGALVLAACGGKDKVKDKDAPPAPPKPEVRQVVITADPDINPDVGGRPSPVVVRIYQLSDGGAFLRASLGELLHGDAATLADSMKSRREVVVTPGSSVTVPLERAPDATLVAVVAAFRDAGARWKDAAPWSKEDLAVRLSKRELQVGSAEVEVPEKH